MKFIGQVWKEGKEMRGRINFIDKNESAPDHSIFFKSFDELKEQLEKEYKKWDSR